MRWPPSGQKKTTPFVGRTSAPHSPISHGGSARYDNEEVARGQRLRTVMDFCFGPVGRRRRSLGRWDAPVRSAGVPRPMVVFESHGVEGVQPSTCHGPAYTGADDMSTMFLKSDQGLSAGGRSLAKTAFFGRNEGPCG
jgi:hypothetical protein